MSEKYFDVIIIGAGAAGLMCAIEAGIRGRKVLVIEHANKPGKKILMSGGGRCNFTNYHIQPECYQSHNQHFVKSALSRYTQWDFLSLVEKHNIPYYEKTLGQLFCVNKSSDIVNMLLTECDAKRVDVSLKTEVLKIIKDDECDKYQLQTSMGKLNCVSLVIATGGLSIPTLGATPFAYKVAEQFNLKVFPTRAGLVPFTLSPEYKEKYANLSGVAVDSTVSVNNTEFKEGLLFTHRGLSGPAILQISSYWSPGDALAINILPDISIYDFLLDARFANPKKKLKTTLEKILPKSLIEVFINNNYLNNNLADCSNNLIREIANYLQDWQIKPDGTEGYRTAEVTLGGVDCDAISSKTMQVKKVPGLYFIGEALDVTGWLGGYNFQWAWSSGFVAGQFV